MSDTVLTLADGRKLTIKQPGILQESRLVRAMGQDATNAAYMTSYVAPSAWVVAIDGDAVIFPNTAREVEGLIQRVGRDGIIAVLNHMVEQANAEQEDDLKN